MDCKKCYYCIQSKRNDLRVMCSNQKLLDNLMKDHDKYEVISEPDYCKFYVSKKKVVVEKGE